MASRQVADRYARALFNLTGEQDDRTPVDEDLAAITTLIRECDTLQEFLRHPLLDKSHQQATLQALFEARVHPTTFRFLRFLVARRRLAQLPRICESFAALVSEARGIVAARITSARPIDPDQTATIIERLEARYGKQLETSTRIDETLLGGFVVQIGDTVHDFSVAGKLRALQRHVAGA